jgi:hypothetical protein
LQSLPYAPKVSLCATVIFEVISRDVVLRG